MPRLSRFDVVRIFAQAESDADPRLFKRDGSFVESGSTYIDRDSRELVLKYQSWHVVARRMELTVGRRKIRVYWISSDNSLGRAMYGGTGIAQDVHRALDVAAHVPADGKLIKDIDAYYFRSAAPILTWKEIVKYVAKEEAESEERHQKRAATAEKRKTKAQRVLVHAQEDSPEKLLAETIVSISSSGRSVEAIARRMMTWLVAQPKQRGGELSSYGWKRVEQLALAMLRTQRHDARLDSGERERIEQVVAWLASSPSEEKIAAQKLLTSHFVSKDYLEPTEIVDHIVAHDWAWNGIFLPGIRYDMDKVASYAQELLPAYWKTRRYRSGWTAEIEAEQRPRLATLLSALKLSQDPAATDKVIEAFFAGEPAIGGELAIELRQGSHKLLTRSDKAIVASATQFFWNGRQGVFITNGTDFTDRLIAQVKKRKLAPLVGALSEWVGGNEHQAALLYARTVLGIEIPRQHLYDNAQSTVTRLIELWGTPSERIYPDDVPTEHKGDVPPPGKGRLLDMTREPRAVVVVQPKHEPRLIEMPGTTGKGFFSQGAEEKQVAPTVESLPPSRAEVVAAGQAAFSWRAGHANAVANNYEFFRHRAAPAQALLLAVAEEDLPNEYPSWFIEIKPSGNEILVRLLDNPEGAGDRWSPRNAAHDRVLHTLSIDALINFDAGIERELRATVVLQGPAARTITDRGQWLVRRIHEHRQAAIDARMVKDSGDVPPPDGPRLIDMDMDVQLPSDFEERAKKIQAEGKRLLEMSKAGFTAPQVEAADDAPLEERLIGATVCWPKGGPQIRLVPGNLIYIDVLHNRALRSHIAGDPVENAHRDSVYGRHNIDIDVCGIVVATKRSKIDNAIVMVVGLTDAAPVNGSYFAIAYTWDWTMKNGRPVISAQPGGGTGLRLRMPHEPVLDKPRLIDLDGLVFSRRRR